MIRALAFLLAGPALAGEIAPEVLDALPPADVVILGEIHDNPQHHANQARAVAALAPKALVFEMLLPEQAIGAAGVDRQDAAALASALDWDAEAWPGFSQYHPIFTASSSAAVLGGALPQAAIRRAIREGAAAVFGAEAERYGLTRPLAPEDQAAREGEQAAAHCGALPEDIVPGFVEAQRLRDAGLARAVIAALEAYGPPVAVITGTGHARKDTGIPAVLAIAAPGLRVYALGQVEADPGPGAPFDGWIVTGPAPRSDPCAGFKVN